MGGLSESVGLAGVNRHPDVATVQRLLAAAGAPPGPIDGRCGRLTIGAVVAFQKGFMHEPDGRVDVNGPTWRRLGGGAGHAAAPAHPAGAAARPAPAQRPSGPAPSSPRPAQSSPAPSPAASPPAGGLHYTDHLPLPPPGTVNVGLVSPPNSLLKSQFGTPRDGFTSDCQEPTDKRIAAAIVTQDVGPFRVTGLGPAVASLREVFGEIRRDHADLHAKLGTAGMMCCRLVRGSSTSISNHSWGTAIDMKIDGALVPWRSGYVLVGLAIIAPYFNRHGWFWGAGYRGSKDPHHFECGSALISSFRI